MVYFGCGWHFKPINDRYPMVQNFIYVDALPKMKHYESWQAGYYYCSTLRKLFYTVVIRVRKLGGRLTSYGSNYWNFSLPNSRTLRYYFNTTVVEALQMPVLGDDIRKAEHLYIFGFAPQRCGLKPSRDMPNAIVWMNRGDWRDHRLNPGYYDM